MFYYNRFFFNIYSRFNQQLKCMSQNASKIRVVFEFKNNFSPEENSKILDTLNTSNEEELLKYKISNARIKKIISWKAKKGAFNSIHDVLEVEGFGEKILQDICKNIIGNKNLVNSKKNPKNSYKIKNLLTPAIGADIIYKLQSAVAIHVEPIGIAWAQLSQPNNTLSCWICENFSCLPQKMLPTETFYLGLKILRKTPPADLYVFEGSNNLSPKSQSKSAAVCAYSQQLELISMLLALLNTSNTHNATLQNVNPNEPFKTIENRVFFLRQNLPARLFNTLMGSEKVSAMAAINDLLKYKAGDDLLIPCSPITFDPRLKMKFFNQSSANKELMAKALMLAVTFMDLNVYKNSVSFDALRPNMKKQRSVLSPRQLS